MQGWGAEMQVLPVIYLVSPFIIKRKGKSLELPYGVGIVGKVGNEFGRTQ